MTDAVTAVAVTPAAELFSDHALQNLPPTAPTVIDVANFQSVLARTGIPEADAAQGAQAPGPAEPGSFRNVLESLDSLNGRVDLLSDSALEYASGAREFTPGDMLEMTVRCHQFLFQCELTTNVANRSSDGIQQLFRQQS